MEMKEGYRMETPEEFKERHARSRIILICGAVTVAVMIIAGFVFIYGGHYV